MLWVGGAFLPSDARIAIWIVALIVDYAGPYAGYWVPGMGRVGTTDWQIEPSHFAERFQLFVIIALGESIVVTGVTASSLELDGPRVMAIAIAFLSSAALWWLYFTYVSRIAQLRLTMSDDPGRLARDAYTYIHIPIVAGVIVTAVGDELVIAHPTDRFDGAELAALAAGPALYLIGHGLFRLRMAGSISWKRMSAAGGCVVAGFLGVAMDAIWVAAIILGILVALIASEHVAAARRQARGEASPIERLVQFGVLSVTPSRGRGRRSGERCMSRGEHERPQSSRLPANVRSRGWGSRGGSVPSPQCRRRSFGQGARGHLLRRPGHQLRAPLLVRSDRVRDG